MTIDVHRLVDHDQSGRRGDSGLSLHDKEVVAATSDQQHCKHDDQKAAAAPATATAPKAASFFRRGWGRGLLRNDGRRRWLYSHSPGKVNWWLSKNRRLSEADGRA